MFVSFLMIYESVKQNEAIKSVKYIFYAFGVGIITGTVLLYSSESINFLFLFSGCIELILFILIIFYVNETP